MKYNIVKIFNFINFLLIRIYHVYKKLYFLLQKRKQVPLVKLKLRANLSVTQKVRI